MMAEKVDDWNAIGDLVLSFFLLEIRESLLSLLKWMLLLCEVHKSSEIHYVV